MGNKNGKLVLVVDDDDELPQLNVIMMGRLGFSAKECENTSKAKEWLSKNKPKLILLDVMMPDGNGLDFCRWIKAQPGLEAIPVLILSAISDDETVQDALEMGAVNFIHKPFTFDELKEKVER